MLEHELGRGGGTWDFLRGGVKILILIIIIKFENYKVKLDVKKKYIQNYTYTFENKIM